MVAVELSVRASTAQLSEEDPPVAGFSCPQSLSPGAFDGRGDESGPRVPPIYFGAAIFDVLVLQRHPPTQIRHA